MTACLLYAKIHKNKAENLLHLMLYFSEIRRFCQRGCSFYHIYVKINLTGIYLVSDGAGKISRKARFVRISTGIDSS